MAPGDRHRPRARFDDYYRSRRNAFLFRWLDLAKLRVIRRALAPLGRAAVVVDLGAGAGGIAFGLRRAGFERVLCLDHDPALLGMCRQRGLAAAAADLERPLPLASGGVDGLVMVDVVEHLEELRLLVAEVRRVLRPGGVGVVFTPPYDSARWVLAERAHRLLTRRWADHVSPCTEESLRHLLGRHFAEARLGRTNFGLSMYAVLRG